MCAKSEIKTKNQIFERNWLSVFIGIFGIFGIYDWVPLALLAQKYGIGHTPA